MITLVEPLLATLLYADAHGAISKPCQNIAIENPVEWIKADAKPYVVSRDATARAIKLIRGRSHRSMSLKEAGKLSSLVEPGFRYYNLVRAGVMSASGVSLDEAARSAMFTIERNVTSGTFLVGSFRMVGDEETSGVVIPLIVGSNQPIRAIAVNCHEAQ